MTIRGARGGEGGGRKGRQETGVPPGELKVTGRGREEKRERSSPGHGGQEALLPTFPAATPYPQQHTAHYCPSRPISPPSPLYHVRVSEGANVREEPRGAAL